MTDLFDYLTWRGDLSFSQDKLNEIDALIFSQLTFLNLEAIVKDNPVTLGEALDIFYAVNPPKSINLGLIVPKTIIDLGERIKNVPRFKDVLVERYALKINKNITEQFCGVSFICGDTIVVAYQGTDDTIVGWEENFNMIAKYPIPAQTSAKLFIDDVCKRHPDKKIIICGHSKGGNLAMYAGMYMDEKYFNNVEQIYNFDGPGFEIKYIPDELRNRIVPKLINIMPYRSIIGMLLTSIGDIIPVKSKNRGVFQHDAFSWYVDVNHFTRVPELSVQSHNINKGILDIISKMTYEEREEFCISLRKATDETGFNTLLELKSNSLKLIKGYKYFSSKSKKIFFELTKLLVKNKVL